MAKRTERFFKSDGGCTNQKNAKQVLDLLKELYDAKFHNFDYEYNLKILHNTHVVALEDLNTNLSDLRVKPRR